jgi:hypothetical protein
LVKTPVRLDPRVARMVAGLEGRRRTSLVFEPAEGDAYDAADQVSAVLKGIFEGYRWTPAISAPLAFPSIVPLGSKVFMDFDFVDEEEALEQAALSLANALTREGWSGRVFPGRPVPPSRRIPLDRVNALAAGIALPYLPPAPEEVPRRASRRWRVSEELTDQVLEFAFEWVSPTGASYFADVGGHALEMSRKEVDKAIRHHLSGFPPAALFQLTDIGFRRVSFDSVGHVSFVVGGCDEDWAEPLESLTDLLRSWADTARYGLVRRCVAPMAGWLATYNMYPSPAVYPHYYGDAPALEAAWVADPQGVQLFTDAHLQGINLDSSWTVEPVTTGKHLVKARDLGQWFDLGRPIDSTLAEARSQFSSILLTDDIALSAWETPRPP